MFQHCQEFPQEKQLLGHETVSATDTLEEVASVKLVLGQKED